MKFQMLFTWKYCLCKVLAVPRCDRRFGATASGLYGSTGSRDHPHYYLELPDPRLGLLTKPPADRSLLLVRVADKTAGTSADKPLTVLRVLWSWI